MFPNRSTTMMYSNATSKYVVAMLHGSTALQRIASLLRSTMLQDCVTALLLCAMFLALRKARSWRYAAELHGDKGERTEALQQRSMEALRNVQCSGCVE